jgi:D-glycero-alpha-D-manno-heptose-7-phosphate kinase
MLFFTGLSRSASEIAGAQIANTPAKERELKTMYDMVDTASSFLKEGNVDAVGRMLHESWQLKRGLSHLVTTSKVDEIYEAGLAAGALGGKLLGAGGGGFILFYADPAVQPKIKERLKDLLYVPFHFETEGTKLIYHNNDTTYASALKYG